MNEPRSPSDASSDLVDIRTFEGASDLQLIHGYGGNSFRISGERYSGAVIVYPRQTTIWTPPAKPETLKIDDLLPHFGDGFPPLFILGVGGAPMDPMNDLSAALRNHGIALEVMSTAAACRTWNVLMSEGRDAVTGLYDVA
ncbi:Mth938-like domain-containing protein [Alphaproteobacteria bacterium]|nr:Mth938-like domain-containing protein [Alphaproteobacteria bacterium]MDG2490010.1 Mth938-like domain-containing protein [Alphaproteobacteria bacterium]